VTQPVFIHSIFTHPVIEIQSHKVVVKYFSLLYMHTCVAQMQNWLNNQLESFIKSTHVKRIMKEMLSLC